MLAHQRHLGVVVLVLGLVHQGVVHDNELVARLDQQGGGTVDLDDAVVTQEDVGLESLAIRGVGDLNRIAGAQADGAEQSPVDGDRADVVGPGGGDGGHVDLAVEDFSEHGKGMVRAGFVGCEFGECRSGAIPFWRQRLATTGAVRPHYWR